MFFITLSLALYFAPALLASSRHHPSAGTIALVNAVAGWTVIGWLICLVWALSEPARPSAVLLQLPVHASQYSGPSYPAGWSAAPTATPQSICRVCSRPVLPTAAFCSMCGATLL